MKEKNPIDELFKQGLENKEIKPSDAAWTKIEEAMMPEDSKKGGFYFMRAAVVTLLIGISSWVYLSNNPLDFGSDVPISPTTLDAVAVENTADVPGEPKKPRTKGTGTKSGTTKGTDPKINPPKTGTTRITPILKSTGSTRAKYVSNEPQIAPAIEDTRMMDYEMFVTEALVFDEDPTTKKVNIRKPVTKDTYYREKGNTEEEPVKKLKFRERVFAYASDQFDNLISGEPLELPKTEIKGIPKLEISLGKFLTKE